MRSAARSKPKQKKWHVFVITLFLFIAILAVWSVLSGKSAYVPKDGKTEIALLKSDFRTAGFANTTDKTNVIPWTFLDNFQAQFGQDLVMGIPAGYEDSSYDMYVGSLQSVLNQHGMILIHGDLKADSFNENINANNMNAYTLYQNATVICEIHFGQTGGEIFCNPRAKTDAVYADIHTVWNKLVSAIHPTTQLKDLSKPSYLETNDGTVKAVIIEAPNKQNIWTYEYFVKIDSGGWQYISRSAPVLNENGTGLRPCSILEKPEYKNVFRTDLQVTYICTR